MFVRRLWPILLFFMPLATEGLVNPTALPTVSPLAARERDVFRAPIHADHFADVPHFTARARCLDTRPPQALATPNPLLDGAEAESSVTVSFIVGTDGKVHSPLILEGGDAREDRMVLDAVRHWRYRPATCNGVPTEVEAKVEFSGR
jgi:TonB family protein